MPTANNGWVVLLDGENREEEKQRVERLAALVSEEIGEELQLPFSKAAGKRKLSASNLFRYALSRLAEEYGVNGFPLLHHGRKKAEE